MQVWLGGDIEIDATERVQLPEGQYFHDQIIGLKVETVDGRRVGKSGTRSSMDRAMMSTSAPTEDDEYMIPAVDVFIKSIDIKAGKNDH